MPQDAFARYVTEQQEKRKSQKKRSGVKPWEMERFNLSINERAMIRFLDPNGIPDPTTKSKPEGDSRGFYTRRFHWPEGGAPATCTSEIAEFEGKCCYCHYNHLYNEEQKKKKDEAESRGQKYNYPTSRLRPQDQHVMEVIDFRFYHIANGEKADEKIVTLCNIDGPVGDPERCELCNSQNEEEAKRVFGGHRLWELKPAQLDQIMPAHQKLKKVCVHRGENGDYCGQEAYVVSFNCEKCKADLEDPQKVRRMDQKAVATIASRIYECECGHKGFPESTSACKSNEHEAETGSIWSKNLWVDCSGETKKAFDKTEYEAKIFTFDTTAEAICPIEDFLAMELGLNDEEIEKLVTPWNLPHHYRPEYIHLTDKDGNEKPIEQYLQDVLDKQAEKLNKPNPYATTKKSSGFGSKPTRSFARR